MMRERKDGKMLLEKKEGAGKRKRRKIAIGYDLGDDYAQISYCFLDGETVETLAVVTGTEQYNIPVVLCRKKGVNQWLFGREAVKFAGEGFKVEGLVGLARKGEMVDVGGESFDPVALLALFIKRSLSLLTLVAPPDWLEGLMFTADNLDKRMVEVLAQVGANLHLKTDKIYFQSHVESYYYYMLHQPEELWVHEALLCDYDNRRLKIYGFSINNRTIPKVALISIEEYREMGREEALGRMAVLGRAQKTEGIQGMPETFDAAGAADSAEMELTEAEKGRLDEIFAGIMRKKCNGNAISSVYLIGNGYKDGWASESLRYLCRGRRVFQGNNLYSKGACQGIREKLGIEHVGEEYVFLGLDKLKSNIGMRLLRRGQESYFALMDAGTNWFETEKEFDVILEDGESVSVLLTPLDGKEPTEISMKLEGLKERPKWATRLNIKAKMLSEKELGVSVKDMGFGDFFPASGGEWNKVFEI